MMISPRMLHAFEHFIQGLKRCGHLAVEGDLEAALALPVPAQLGHRHALELAVHHFAASVFPVVGLRTS